MLSLLSPLDPQVAGALDYSRKLAALKGDEELPPGLGPVSIAGSSLAAEGKQRELRELYKAYLDVQIEAAGQVTAALDEDAKDLQVRLCKFRCAGSNGLSLSLARK